MSKDYSDIEKDYRNMSSREAEVDLCAILTIYGYRCNGPCRRSIQELIELREIEELTTGKKFTTRAITIDHINGDSHQRDGQNGEYCRNLQPMCWSCNKRKGGLENVTVVHSQKEKSQEKQDYLDGLPALINWLQTYLIQNEEICYKEMVFASKQANGLSPVTNERNIQTEIKTDSNAIKNGRFQAFPYDCGGRLCNHDHICLSGYKPTKLINAEKEKLLAEWQKDYGISKDEYYKQQSIYNISQSYMTFDEFVLSKGKLLVYNFK